MSSGFRPQWLSKRQWVSVRIFPYPLLSSLKYVL